MKILGVNVYGHDTAAALVIDGKLVSAVEEERLSRRKHDRELPFGAIDFCLKNAGIAVGEIDLVAFSTDLDVLIKRKYLQYHLENYDKAKAHLVQAIAAVPEILSRQQRLMDKIGYTGEFRSVQHHLCHLASAYYQSGFAEAAAVSIDGQGEFETTLMGHAVNGEISAFDNVEFPHSLGFLYVAHTYFLGFKPNSAEGTVMALAALGDADALVPGQSRSFYSFLEEMVSITDDGHFRIDTDWFNFPFTREGWVSDKFRAVFGEPRQPETTLDQFHFNMAAALQRRFEDAYLNVLDAAQRRTSSKNLALAGGSALNCVANGKIIRRTGFEHVYIQPAAGDAGCAIGAAQIAAHEAGDKLPVKARVETYLGPSYGNDEIKAALEKRGVAHQKVDDPSKAAAELIFNGKVIAWFQGAAEFGPRALGNRSILAAPFPLEVKDRINAKVKHREFFRPFAPAVLEERFDEVFDGYRPSPFMLMAMTVKPAWYDKVPAILHADDSARVQTVAEETTPRFYNLIKAFEGLSGVPVVLNTSFNDKGEPMVCSPDDALKTFLGTQIDALVIGDYVVTK